VRVLEQHRDPGAAHIAHIGFVELEQVDVAEHRAPTGDVCRRRVEDTEHRAGVHRLARARLAEHGDDLALAELV
jgi:hypothetical protein